MRYLLLAAIVPASLAGCATGHASDWFRDPPSIINPQLIRYGMDVQQSRCVSDKLGASLTRPQLRRLTDLAAGVEAPDGTATFTLATLRGVANGTGDPAVRLELDKAAEACGVTELPAARMASSTAAADPSSGGRTSGGVPVDTTPVTVAPGAAAATGAATTWLNLGSADSGQSIAVDAMSIRQEGVTRTAWFRMTDPDSGGPSNNSYRLRVDCQARTVQPLALRQTDAAGVQTSLREYTPAEATPGAAESGTVLEIAYLSLCT